MIEETSGLIHNRTRQKDDLEYNRKSIQHIPRDVIVDEDEDEDIEHYGIRSSKTLLSSNKICGFLSLIILISASMIIFNGVGKESNHTIVDNNNNNNNSKGSGSPPTNSPTMQIPTEKQDVINVYNLSNITTDDVEKWELFYRKQAEHVLMLNKMYNKTKNNVDELDQEHDSFCQKMDTPTSKNNFTLIGGEFLSTEFVEEMKAKVSNEIEFLCKYYFPVNGFCDLSGTILPRNIPSAEQMEKDAFKKGLSRYVAKFAHKIVFQESFEIGIIGKKNGLAGIENKFDATYENLIKVGLSNILKDMNVTVNVYNKAQTELGESMYVMMACSKNELFDFSKLDAIHAQWDFLRQLNKPVQERIIRDFMKNGILPYILDSNSIVQIYSDGEQKRKWFQYMQLGYLEGVDNNNCFDCDSFPEREGIFPWAPPEPLDAKDGRKGDGRCHLKTVNGHEGVYRLRYDTPGPLQHELMANKILFYYYQAILQALIDIESHLKSNKNIQTIRAFYANKTTSFENHTKSLLENDTNLIYPKNTCEGDSLCNAPFSERGMFCATNETLEKYIIKDSQNLPFENLHEFGNWTRKLLYTQNNDRNVYGYSSPDDNGWINFKMPPLEQGKVIICTVGDSGKKSPYHHYIFEEADLRQDNIQMSVLTEEVDDDDDERRLQIVQGTSEKCIYVTDAAETGKPFIFSVKAKNLPITTIIAL